MFRPVWDGFDVRLLCSRMTGEGVRVRGSGFRKYRYRYRDRNRDAGCRTCKWVAAPRRDRIGFQSADRKLESANRKCALAAKQPGHVAWGVSPRNTQPTTLRPEGARKL
jgi:hypothetical protein